MVFVTALTATPTNQLPHSSAGPTEGPTRMTDGTWLHPVAVNALQLAPVNNDTVFDPSVVTAPT